MSEAELHVIKARLRGGILNKARRGEFRCNVVLEPDMQVRETIVHFFGTFARVGSASQTVKAFRKEGLLFPSRLHIDRGARPEQSALRRRLCLWPATLSARHRWQEDCACTRQ